MLFLKNVPLIICVQSCVALAWLVGTAVEGRGAPPSATIYKNNKQLSNNNNIKTPDATQTGKKKKNHKNKRELGNLLLVGCWLYYSLEITTMKSAKRNQGETKLNSRSNLS